MYVNHDDNAIHPLANLSFTACEVSVDQTVSTSWVNEDADYSLVQVYIKIILYAFIVAMN